MERWRRAVAGPQGLMGRQGAAWARQAVRPATSMATRRRCCEVGGRAGLGAGVYWLWYRYNLVRYGAVHQAGASCHGT